MQGFDFSTIKTNHEMWLDVKHPKTGDSTGARILLAGPEHEKHKQLMIQKARDARRAAEKAGKFVLGDPQDDLVDAMERAVACTLNWDGVNNEGAALAPSADNVRGIYASAPWLLTQVLAFIGNAGNFIVSVETA